MASDFPLTYEELLDNYEFKVGRRILIREYPWIKDVILKDPEDVNKYNLIFVDNSLYHQLNGGAVIMIYE